MNAPKTPDLLQRTERQAAVVRALSAVLPAHALLWHNEDTVPYECDGLTAYRQRPLVVALPETRSRCRPCCAPAMRWPCRWWRAVRAPGCRAAPCHMRWA
jgi:hypothetical protein